MTESVREAVMLSARSKVAAVSTLLHRDCQELARALLTSPAERWSYRKIAKRAQVSEPVIRRMDRDGWSATLKTLLSIEKGFRDHPFWRSSRGIEHRETSDDRGFMLRRLRPATAEPFTSLVASWAAGDYRAIETDDRASIVETSGRPDQYRISRHAPQVVAASGVDRTGMSLGEGRAAVYASATLQDYLFVRHTERPMFSEVLWYSDEAGEGRYYERVLLPLPGRIASVVVVHNPRFSGSLAYSANISL